MTVILRRILAKLRREPVAVWGVVAASILGLLPVLGVPGSTVETITVLLTLLGIPVVRANVTPLAALRSLITGKPYVAVFSEPSSGLRLGRHVEHDPRSRAYPAPLAAAVKSVRWTRRSPVFDQGAVGSCTGNAAAGWLATDTALRRGRSDITEDVALAIYARATHLDSIRGSYPAHDTGSSGLAAAKAMNKLGLTTGPYRHAFGLQHALQALQAGPVLVGIAWRTGCDQPDAAGLVSWSGSVRGGHEILADEVDTDRQLVGFTNSWGASWGRSGRFYMTFADFGAALAQHGDVTVLG